MFSVTVRLVVVGVCIASMSSVAVAIQPSFHDSYRYGTPAIAIFGVIEDAGGPSRYASLSVEYVSYPDGYVSYPGMWLSYSDGASFEEYYEGRILYCPVDLKAVQVSPQGSLATLSADLVADTCYQEAYRYWNYSGEFEALDALSGVIRVRVSLERATQVAILQRNGTETTDTSTFRYSCRTEFSNAFQEVMVEIDLPGKFVTEVSDAVRSVCNTSQLDRDAP